MEIQRNRAREKHRNRTGFIKSQKSTYRTAKNGRDGEKRKIKDVSRKNYPCLTLTFLSIRTSSDGSPLPLPSVIRNTLLTNKDVFSTRLNVLFTGFGQFMDHDVTHQQQIDSPDKCCINGKPAPFLNPNTCLPTLFLPNDPFYSKFGITCMDLKRAVNTYTLGCPIRPVYQINYQTAFMDLSILYGTSTTKAYSLRALTGGLLKTSDDARTSFQEYPYISSGLKNCPIGGVSPFPGNTCFMAGDSRINQNPELLVADTVFLRLHNNLARQLKSLNPQWNDERIYQEARRLNIAMYQHVISAEFAPLVVGPFTASLYKLYPLGLGRANGYSPLVNPQTLESYSAAAGRSGHSAVAGHVNYIGPAGLPETYTLRYKYFNNKFLLGKNMFLNIIKAYTREACGKIDQYFSEEINNWLFDSIGAPYGQDLSDIDILRGRDYGLPGYNTFRAACGLCRLKTFEDLASEIRNPTDVIKLRALYKNVEDIDLYVGALLEKPLPGSIQGPTFSCINAESFYRWKFGDRLYYEFPQAGFSQAQLFSIKTTTTWASILCTTIPFLPAVPRNAFQLPSSQNPLIPCSQIPRINLMPWKTYTY
ncbi:hypothetical protein V9T40_012369 [Parthenolecanium corni]|uniref:Peroxidase n=1 Tax=Parthenolecanium corni TaxID=536013 RepID=A0AAN9TAY9_9HEMI